MALAESAAIMRTDMDYETLIENLVYWSKASHVNPRSRYALRKAANAITDLIVENQSLRNDANGFKARAEAAEARCETLEKMVMEYQDEIVPGYREWAEKAEREKNEAVESICMRCSVLPCRKNECYWYRFKKEE